MKNEFITPFTKIEVREDSGAPKIFGLSVPYGKVSRDLGGFREIFEPGSLTKTLKENRSIKSHWAHNPGQVLGSQKNGTLEVRESSEGISFEVTPNMDTTYGRDAVASVKRGDVDSCSFKFEAVRDRFTRETEDGKPYVLRHVIEARLFQCDPVSDPAYTETYVGLRDFQIAKNGELRDSLAKRLNEWKDKELTKENKEELRTLMISIIQTDDDEEEEEETVPSKTEPVPEPPQPPETVSITFDRSIIESMEKIDQAYEVLKGLNKDK